MASSLDVVLNTIHTSAEKNTPFSQDQLKTLVRSCLKDKVKVIVKKAVNWYLKPAGEYVLFAPKESVAYLEIDSTREDVIKFSSEHVVIYTNLIVGTEVCKTVVKFRLNRMNNGSTVKVQHLTPLQIDEAFLKYKQLDEHCTNSNEFAKVRVNSTCILEIPSMYRLLGMSSTLFWVEKRLSNFQKFLVEPSHFDPSNMRMYESLLTSSSEPLLRKLQEDIFKKSGNTYTVCDLQGCKTPDVPLHLGPLFDKVLGAGVMGAVGTSVGSAILGPVGFVAGGLLGMLVGANAGANKPAERAPDHYFVLGDIEFTNTLGKFGYSEQNLRLAFKQHLVDEERARKVEEKRMESMRRLSEEQRRREEEALLLRLEEERKRSEALQAQQWRIFYIASGFTILLWSWNAWRPSWLTWLTSQLASVAAYEFSKPLELSSSIDRDIVLISLVVSENLLFLGLWNSLLLILFLVLLLWLSLHLFTWNIKNFLNKNGIYR